MLIYLVKSFNDTSETVALESYKVYFFTHSFYEEASQVGRGHIFRDRFGYILNKRTLRFITNFFPHFPCNCEEKGNLLKCMHNAATTIFH